MKNMFIGSGFFLSIYRLWQKMLFCCPGIQMSIRILLWCALTRTSDCINHLHDFWDSVELVFWLLEIMVTDNNLMMWF